MTDEETFIRIRQGEDSRTQFKRGPVGVARLAAELTAFTNAEVRFSGALGRRRQDIGRS